VRHARLAPTDRVPDGKLLQSVRDLSVQYYVYDPFFEAEHDFLKSVFFFEPVHSFPTLVHNLA